jgi:RimJ/RimL family protein N-acetyltransferase
MTETERPAPSRALIRSLDPEQLALIEQHLLSLSGQDRYLRFGYPAIDEQISRYVAKLDFGRDELFGIFDAELQLVAVAHLAYLDTPGQQHMAEFGVSVSPELRGCGYGQQLFERCVVHARNHGVSRLIVHALSENAAMLKIARNAGASVVREGTESQAYLELPPADFGSQVGEMLAEGLARTDYHLKSGVKQVRGVIDLMHEIREGVRDARDQTKP